MLSGDYTGEYAHVQSDGVGGTDIYVNGIGWLPRTDAHPDIRVGQAGPYKAASDLRLTSTELPTIEPQALHTTMGYPSTALASCLACRAASSLATSAL